MSDTSSELDSLDISEEDSEYNFIPGHFFPVECEPGVSSESDFEADENIRGVEPYSAEPLADENWLEEYNKRQEEKKQKLEKLKDRLVGKETIKNWCKCGNCNVKFLQNAYECCCCRDMEGCVEVLQDKWVIEELEKPPQCITLHPAFKNTCLERWSLRLSAGKCRKIDKRAYHQTGSEEAFMRSVAYREFTHLVYGVLGKNRIPLPACSYHAIREKFQAKDSVERFRGFQEDESEDQL
ncbi:uncharacterized protein LOC110246688 [Exaiptasia diaphana]|uniref:P2X purinoreceptor 7 intracellular domain-containing protein n=1 Tax=Exaiptasia diaphana TaxID=2652724 RepID=A0A913XQQ9_EXADI|nr:uncharacterized protein LOC110246688 [Exaiptasia diaphana]KXJ09646.1 hypothetical protein AC249_AIPGENE11447 [Exaiptasia diaphana]